MNKKSNFPLFKTAFVSLGGLHVLLASSLFIKGFPESMAPFQVPPKILQSLHYLDAMHWVYTHMIVIGFILIVIGLYAESMRFKKAFSRMMFLAYIYYTYLDFRSSDSVFGNQLYKGSESLIPAFMGVFFTLCFFYFGFFHFKEKQHVPHS